MKALTGLFKQAGQANIRLILSYYEARMTIQFCGEELQNEYRKSAKAVHVVLSYLFGKINQ